MPVSLLPFRRVATASYFATALAILLALSSFAQAQTPAVPKGLASGQNLPPISPIATQTFPGELPLYPGAKAKAEAEQWDLYIGENIVRNVVTPTIIPYLPAPGNATGAAVILALGGAYLYLGMGSTETDARRLQSLGIAAFVLKYRTTPTARDEKTFLTNMFKMLMGLVAANNDPKAPRATVTTPPVALQDGRAALRLVRARSSEWGIDPRRVGFAGGSAGAALAMELGLAADAAERPDFLGAIIGPKSVKTVPAYAPPIFIASSVDDPLAPGTGETIVAAWTKAKRPIEAHFYAQGGHGLPKDADWVALFHAWMGRQGLLKPLK